MNKALQKIVFFIAIVALTNTLSAQNWPVFSTHLYPSDYIELNRPFNSDTHYSDSVYTYDIDNTINQYQNILTDPDAIVYANNQSIETKNTINFILENKISRILLLPKDNTLEEDTMCYHILFEGMTLFSTITLKREKIQTSVIMIESENEEIENKIKKIRKKQKKQQYKHRAQKPDNAGKFVWWQQNYIPNNNNKP